MKSQINRLPVRKPTTSRATRVPRKVGLQQCLIVAADTVRQSMFVDAASEAGWETLLASDAAAALSLLSREFVGMAIVDLEGRQATDFHPLFDRLRKTTGLLSVVCGNEGNASEEVYVRQTSPWLYLPGVQLGAEFSTLCQQARQVAERTQITSAALGATRGMRRSG